MHPLVAQLTAVNARLARGAAVRRSVVRDPVTQQIRETIESREAFDPAALARDADAILAAVRASTDMNEGDRILATAAAIDYSDLLSPHVSDPASRANLEQGRAANQAWLDAAGVRVDPR